MPLPGLASGGAGAVMFPVPIVGRTGATMAATSLVLTKPSGMITGDFLIAAMGTASAGTWTGDTGWTERLDQGVAPSLRLATLTIAGGEGANFTYTASVSDNGAGILVALRGGQYDTISTAATRTGDGSLAIGGITMAGKGMLLAVVATNVEDATHSTPTGMAATYRLVNGSGYTISMFHKRIYQSGATGSQTSTVGGATSAASAGVLIGVTVA